MRASEEAAVKSEIDKVFKANPQFPDYRKRYPWFTGHIGDLSSRVMFIAENPSLRGIKKGDSENVSLDSEIQWQISRGDMIFRGALVKSGFKDGPPKGKGGWHCYITNLVKLAGYPSVWNAKSEEDRFRIAKEFAPVLQKEIAFARPRLIVVMGKGRLRNLFERMLHENVIVLPPKTKVEYVQHYAYFNRGGYNEERLKKYEESFKELRRLLNEWQ